MSAGAAPAASVRRQSGAWGGTGQAWGCHLHETGMALVKCPRSRKHRETRAGSRAGRLGPGSRLGGQVAVGWGGAWLLKKGPSCARGLVHTGPAPLGGARGVCQW